MALHDPEAGEKPDDGEPGRQAQLAAEGSSVLRRAEALAVGATRQRYHAIIGQESRRDALPANGFAHRHHQVRRLAEEPAVQGMRANRLDDVTGADERALRSGHPVRDGSQPVLLAAMDMDDVGAR